MARIYLIALLTVAGVSLLPAQPAAVQQLQNDQLTRQLTPGSVASSLAVGSNAPALFPGENEDVGPQRILRLQPRHKWFDLVLDTQFFVSDNANFEIANRAISSGVFVNTMQAAFTPPALKLGSGELSGALGFSSQWYNYEAAELEPLDFNAHTIFLTGKYVTGHWSFGLGLNATRLLAQSDDSETYRELMPNFGVSYQLPLTDRMFFSLGNITDYHFTEVPEQPGTRTDLNDRFDNISSLTFTWMVTSRFVIQPYYRFQYSLYPHDTLAATDRTDIVHSLGITAAYFFNDKFSVRAYYNYNRKESDDRFVPDYREMNGGAGLSFNWKF